MNEIAEFIHVVNAQFNEIKFINNTMTKNWYNGRFDLYGLSIRTEQLDTIHASAFDQPAFHSLWYLFIRIERGAVYICDKAFQGIEKLQTIHFDARLVDNLPRGLFNPFAGTICRISFLAWPNNMNLNEMFAGGPNRLLKLLDIRHVRMPQTLFQLLAADNFTSFRRLTELVLYNCGIEVIEEHAFYAIGRTLTYIHLGANRLKHFNIAMFRSIFETKRLATFEVYNFKFYLYCTCALVELDVMLCPLRKKRGKMCLECMASDEKFRASNCGVLHELKIAGFCVSLTAKRIVRTIYVRMAYADQTISVDTNFSSIFRMIAVDLHAMEQHRCTARVSKRNFKCVKADRPMDRLDLIELSDAGRAELMLIAAIPILHAFGARPVHVVTVRQPPSDEFWLRGGWIWIVLGAVSGLVAGSIFIAIQGPTDQTEAHEVDYSEIQMRENDIELNVLAQHNVFDQEYYYQAYRTPEAFPNDYI